MVYNYTEKKRMTTFFRMRNYLAEDMLNLEMLHAMKMYKNSLGEKGDVLN